MIRTDKIRGLIAQNGLTQKDVAKAIGISDKTFYSKMQKGVFLSTEMETMANVLHIEDPGEIFFAKEVT